MTCLEFELKGLPRMTNSVGRAHWAIKVKEANKWKGLVAQMVFNMPNRPATPFSRARLTLTRYSSVEPDFDGLVSSFKHVVDGLKECAVIVDDKVSVIGQPTYLWEKAPRGEGRIRVRIEAIGEAA